MAFKPPRAAQEQKDQGSHPPDESNISAFSLGFNPSLLVKHISALVSNVSAPFHEFGSSEEICLQFCLLLIPFSRSQLLFRVSVLGGPQLKSDIPKDGTVSTIDRLMGKEGGQMVRRKTEL